ncbi:hypothetical protein DOY81_009360, partial [Sarcophaga bullata]
MDCRVPLVPFEEFYNETLSEAIQMDRDYLSYKNLSLDPLGEVPLLDINDIVYQPNLKLKVRRDNIVNDALIGLELVAMSNPKDLKKQLVVEFVG